MRPRPGSPPEDLPAAMPLKTFAALLLAVVVGSLVAVYVLPEWLPGLKASLFEPSPKAYWYLSRASAVVAYILLWISMVFGVAISNRLARLWPGGPTAYDIHQHASLLGLAAALFHGLILVGDQYTQFGLIQILLPFATASYRPLWVGLGQVALYGLAAVDLSFYVRRGMGHRSWRLIHYVSYAVFALGLIHGLMSGTDAGTGWAQILYWLSGGSLLFLTIYRAITARGLLGPSASAAARPAR